MYIFSFFLLTKKKYGIGVFLYKWMFLVNGRLFVIPVFFGQKFKIENGTHAHTYVFVPERERPYVRSPVVCVSIAPVKDTLYIYDLIKYRNLVSTCEYLCVSLCVCYFFVHAQIPVVHTCVWRDISALYV